MMPGLTLLFRAEISLAPIRDLGHTPAGHRRIIDIIGGKVSGPRLAGKVLPGGADWQVIRADGVAFLDARYTVETADGALVYVRNQGYRHAPPDVLARLMRGEDVNPALYYMRTTPWFETADPRYDWMNRTVCVGSGARRPAGVEIDFYEVT